MSVNATVQQRVRELLERRPDITTARLATAIPGLSRATVFFYISGQYEPTSDTDKHFERVLNQIEAGEIFRADEPAPLQITEEVSTARRLPRKRGFYVIDTTRRVRQLLNYCDEQAVIGICTADFGAGKTESIRHWRESDGHKVEHILFEFDDFSGRNVLDFIGCLASQLNLPVQPNMHTGGKVLRACIEALERRPMLLIFDQCEMVAPRIFQIIRQIWDKTRCAGVGVAIFAAPMLVERLEKSRMRDLGALCSRVGIWATLTGVQKSEVSAILHQEGIAQIDDGATDLVWRAAAGSMRRLMAISDLLASKHAGKAVTERTIAGIAKHLWGLGFSLPKSNVSADARKGAA